MLRTKLLPLAVALGLCISALPVISATAAVQSIGVGSSNAAVTGSAVVAEAEKFIGYPYAYTGDSPATGFSCIGFVWYVYHELGMNIPGSNAAAYQRYPQVTEADLQPGDLVFFQGTFAGLFPSHVGIYIGNDTIIHSENPSTGVTTTALRNDGKEGNYLQDHYLSAERPWTGSSVTGTQIPRRHHVLTVSVASLNLRSGPSMDYSVMTVLARGTRLTVEGWAPGWVRVATLSGTVGWVLREGVSKDGQYHPKAGRHPLTTSERREAWARAKTVYVSGLRVHTAPSLSAEVLFNLVQGNRVGIDTRLDGWDKVVTARGAMGWAMGRYLGRHSSVRHPHRIRTFRHPFESGVMVRSIPSVEGAEVAVSNGLPVRVMHWQRGWAEIELSTGAVGWVSRLYLESRHTTRTASIRRTSRTRVLHNTQTAQHPAARVTSRFYVTATVRVHSAASLAGTVVGFAYAGTHVRILRTGEFDYVRTSQGQYGYIDSTYVA